MSITTNGHKPFDASTHLMQIKSGQTAWDTARRSLATRWRNITGLWTAL